MRAQRSASDPWDRRRPRPSSQASCPGRLCRWPCYPVVREKDRRPASPFPLPSMRNKILARNDSARENAMSQPAAAAFAPLPFELVLDDGEPLETDWHTRELPLLRHLIRQTMAE